MHSTLDALRGLRPGFARLRYLRATLWVLALDAAVLSILAGAANDSISAHSGDDLASEYCLFAAFNLYLLAITAGRLGVGAWGAAQPSYRVLRALGLLLWLATLAVTLIMPANLLFIGRSDMGYEACHTFSCYALLPFIPPLVTGVAVIGALAPTSLLWFRLAKPRAPAPPRRPSRLAPE